LIQSYHHGRFEFFTVVIVIAIIAVAALGRYSIMAEDAQKMRLEIISHHFMTGAANARVEFLLHSIANKNTTVTPFLTIGEQSLYFSDQGWPASTKGLVANDYHPTDEDCYQLWRLLLQNPAPLTKGSEVNAQGDYRVIVKDEACRYQFEEVNIYFDYFPLTGRLLFMPESE
jgi:hypothetical protein